MAALMCYVYRGRGRGKGDTYLYLDRKDDFSKVPEAVMRHLGSLELALEFELTPDRRLARENPREVYDNLTSRGFHIQLPDDSLPTDADLVSH